MKLFSSLSGALVTLVAISSFFAPESRAAPAYPAVCVKMRQEIWKNYAISLFDAQRFTFMNNPQEMLADLNKNPLPPDRERTMLDMVGCYRYWNKQQVQSYIILNHP